MSRTYKDQKQNQVVSIAKSKRQRQPLTTKYLRYKQKGDNSDGDFCPKCGTPTHFETYFLACGNCGWVDAGSEAIDREFAA